MSLMSKKREDQNAISHNDLTPGVVKLERVRVTCPACGQEVEAVASDSQVKGYCAVARRYVDFVAETQRIGIASVRQDPDPDEVVVRDYKAGVKAVVIQDRYGITPGKMYRILHSANVRLRKDQKPKQ